MNEHTKIEVFPQVEPGQDIVIRHGDAATVFDPDKVSLFGVIAAPADFYETRKEKIDALSAYVVANFTHRMIKLRLDEKDQYGTEIVGKLQMYSPLEVLNINKTTYYTHDQLYKLLKFHGAYFKSPEQHAEILGKLKAFNAKVQQDLSSANDYKGAKAQQAIVNISTNLSMEFALHIPIFAGEEAEDFNVEVCVDLIGGEVKFWLESMRLHDMIVEQTESIFESEIERLAPLAIIRQY